VPIFGDPKYFRNGDYLTQYKQHTLLAVNVDSPKMERFVADLRSQGWRVHEAHLTGGSRARSSSSTPSRR
jgi:hypothetical protein